MINSFNNPIYNLWYTNSAGNKVSITKTNESYKIVNNKIFLNNIPDPLIKINYITINSTTIYEVPKGSIIDENSFTVDYELGLIDVSPIYDGQTAIVTSYGARGTIMFPMSRVYDDKRLGSGNVIKTLDQLLVDIETNAMNIVNNLVDSTEHKGEYDPDYTYIKNNEVSYYGSSYIAITTTKNNPPTINGIINSDYWKLSAKKGDNGFNCVSRGVYANEVTYNVNDLVIYLGDVYECIAISTGNLPTNTSYFRPFLTSTSVSSYKNTYIISGTDTNTVPIGISAFNKDTDTLYVYKNSTYIEVTEDYIIDANSENIIKTSGTWNGSSATTFNFIVLKNVNKAYYADGRVLQSGTVPKTALALSLQDEIAFLFNNLDSIVNIKDFGAISGAADNTTPIQNAINTLTKNKILLIPDGSYNITGVTVPMRDVTIIFIGELVFTASSGYALTLEHYHINLINPKIRRVYTGTGVASSDLVGVGLCLHHAKNCTIYNPIIEGFGVGIAYRDSAGLGVAYNTIINPFLTNNLESIKSIHEHANSWTNENKVFSGRISLITSGYTNIEGSAYFNLLGDCHRFYGVSAEGTPERKIKGTFHESTFDGCRFELTNGVLDIEINGSGNKFIGNRDYEDIYVDNGLNNVILSRWYAKFGQPIQQPVIKVKTVYSGDNYYEIDLEPDYCYYLIDANDNKAYVTPRLNSYSKGSIFTIKKIDSSSNPIVLGIANLDNNQIYPTLTKQNETIRIMYDGDKFIVLDNSEYSYSLGYNHITYGVGAKRKYYPTESGYMKYGSRVCIEEGTTGTFTDVTGTGTAGTNTLTLTGTLDRMTSNSWITVGGVNYYVTAWDAVSKVATLKTNLVESVSGATVSRKNPKFAKAERILFEDTAAPTTGTWSKGDIVYNSNPIAGGYIGWVCITAGTPGTWKGFGPIQS